MTDPMKSLLKKKLYGSYMVSSPWILAAAAALLIVIIATFALHNYRLEKRLMRESLEQRAATLVRVLYSNIRVALINEWRQHQQLSSAWPAQLQQVVTHISEDHDIVFLSVADPQGTILAHTDPGKVGSRLPSDSSRSNSNRDVIQYQIISADGVGRVFTATTSLTMFARERGGRGMMGRAPGFEHRGSGIGLNARPGLVSQQFVVAIGLDTQAFEQALSRLQWQILLLSLAMLLVGLGGWLSLAAVQGYRVSQKTVENVQAYTALLVAQLPLGVIATTPGGRIETWNGAMAVLTGCPAKDALGRLPSELLPPVLAGFFDEPGLNSQRQQYQEQSVQRLTLNLAGERRVLLCQPLKITDSLQSYRGRVLLLSNITELNDLEQSMRENEHMAAIGRMAGGVAHEVRNPLSSIKGLAFLLKKKFPDGSREQESAGLLVQETERLNRTITEMLDLTRPSPLQFEAVNMAELLQQSLILMQAELAERQIEVQLHCASDLPQVQGDSDRLRQVLMNVLLNARQAMEGGGTLTVTVGAANDGRWIDILVSDTGRGIPEELLPQVFYPYFTTRENGTGIGLAISHKIVMEHKGSIDIQSEPGQGTGVHIRLPVYSFETRVVLAGESGNREVNTKK